MLGVALWFAILIAAIVMPAARRGPPPIEPYRLGLIAIATAWFVQANFTPFDYAFDNYVVWLLAGIVAGAAAVAAGRCVNHASRPRCPSRPPRHWRFAERATPWPSLHPAFEPPSGCDVGRGTRASN